MRKGWHTRGAGARRYDYLYTPDEVDELADLIARHIQPDRPTYLFFNNHPGGQAAANAVSLSARLKLPLPYGKFAHMAATFPFLKSITGEEGRADEHTVIISNLFDPGFPLSPASHAGRTRPSGIRGHFGARAVQTRAPKSIRAELNAQARPRGSRRAEISHSRRSTAPARGLPVLTKTRKEHAADVGVQDRRVAVEGEAGHRAGGIAPDAFELLQRFRLRGQFAAVMRHRLAGDVVQAHRADVVPQAFPGLLHVVEIGVRQVGQRGVTL